MSDDLDGPKATNPTGEAKNEVLHLDFDRRVMVQFRGSRIAETSVQKPRAPLPQGPPWADLAGGR